MIKTQRIAPCLWFADEAEEAARHYTGIFKNSRITAITHYGTAGFESHHRPPGSVMTVAFQVSCETQEEIDYYWDKLSAGGDPDAQVCGWLKDRYGLSWQVIPNSMDELFKDEESAASQRAMEAMLKMKKLDIAALQHAYDGKGKS